MNEDNKCHVETLAALFGVRQLGGTRAIRKTQSTAGAVGGVSPLTPLSDKMEVEGNEEGWGGSTKDTTEQHEDEVKGSKGRGNR